MKCPTCGGSKRVAVTEWDAKLQRFIYREKPCPKCNGTGSVPNPKTWDKRR